MHATSPKKVIDFLSSTTNSICSQIMILLNNVIRRRCSNDEYIIFYGPKFPERLIIRLSLMSFRINLKWARSTDGLLKRTSFWTILSLKSAYMQLAMIYLSSKILNYKPISSAHNFPGISIEKRSYTF